MHPRQDIVSLNTEATIQDCLELADQTRFSRLPLCEDGNVDKTLGVVHSKDLSRQRHNAKMGRDLQRVAHKLIFIPETARLERLLHLFLERKAHMALVVDEFGGTVGLVTLEDVLEALVGPIEDEFDQEKELIIRTDSHTWELDGALPLYRLAELTGESVQASHQVSTLSGWVLQRLARFPQVGDEVRLPGWALRVLSVAGTRATKMKLERLVERGSREAA